MGSAHSPTCIPDEQVKDNSYEILGTRPACTSADTSPSGISSNPPCMNESMFNPSHIQKVVVEHIMRSELLPTSHSQSRIWPFWGRLPKPNGEVDSDSWHTQVELLLCDFSLSESQKVRRILRVYLAVQLTLLSLLACVHPFIPWTTWSCI